MSDFMNKVKTVNSAVRTSIAVLLLGAVGYGGWFGYDNYIKPGAQAKQALADLADLEAEFKKQEEELLKSQTQLKVVEQLNDRLETSMKLLKVDRRIANVTCLEKGKDETGESYMEVSFTEVDENNEPIGAAKNYTVKGEKLYVDGWVVTFEDQYIEDADELRAASLYVFKSIYGDAEPPRDGQRLDSSSGDQGPPGIYADERKREFEQKIWKDFWEFSNDLELQREMGIRAAYGAAPYIKPEEGKTYQVQIRSSAGWSFAPIDEP